MATPTKPLRKIAEASHLCRSPRCFWAQMGNPGAGPRQGLEESPLKMACFQGRTVNLLRVNYRVLDPMCLMKHHDFHGFSECMFDSAKFIGTH